MSQEFQVTAFQCFSCPAFVLGTCQAGKQALSLAQEVRDIEMIGQAIQAGPTASPCSPSFIPGPPRLDKMGGTDMEMQNLQRASDMKLFARC